MAEARDTVELEVEVTLVMRVLVECDVDQGRPAVPARHNPRTCALISPGMPPVKASAYARKIAAYDLDELRAKFEAEALDFVDTNHDLVQELRDAGQDVADYEGWLDEVDDG